MWSLTPLGSILKLVQDLNTMSKWIVFCLWQNMSQCKTVSNCNKTYKIFIRKRNLSYLLQWISKRTNWWLESTKTTLAQLTEQYPPWQKKQMRFHEILLASFLIFLVKVKETLRDGIFLEIYKMKHCYLLHLILPKQNLI